MRAVVIHGPGGYERLSIEERPTPAPGPGQVRLAVEACGVNFADLAVRLGLYSSAREYVGWPITPGFEVAGRVEAVGDGVTDLAVGDPVLAVTRFGGYASHVVVPRVQALARPPALGADQAAGFPAVFLTAHYALVELAAPRAGAKLLVHSAAGGVGQALCQLGRLRGCEVVGVVGGAHKVEAARQAGAAHVIDRSRGDLWREARRLAPEGYAAIFDANGPSTLREGYRHLAPTGRLIVYGFASMLPRGSNRVPWLSLLWGWLRTPRFDPLRMTNENRSVLAFNLSYLFERSELYTEAMSVLLGHVAAGQLRPLPVRAYPLAEVAEAQRALASGETTGKLVLRP
jgi:NADPH:quinone reductase-like Zn-dependent oxidoreductase